MTRKDIRELRVYATYPAITIVLPCDIERIQRVFLDVTKKIDNKELVAGITERLKELLTTLTCPLQTYSVAVFVHKHCARIYIIPGQVPQIVACDTFFKLDALVQYLNRMQQYWVVDYTTEEPVLCAGFDDACIDVVASVVQVTSPADPFHENFEKSFDQMLSKYLDESPLPLCVVGDAETTYHFTAHSEYGESCVARTANRQEVWQVMQRWFSQQTKEVLEQVAQGKEGIQYHTAFADLHKAAHQGLIRTLLVEKSYSEQGCQHTVTNHIKLMTACEERYDAVSAIDRVIETVRSHGGTVLLVPDESLAQYQHMVGLLID